MWCSLGCRNSLSVDLILVDFFLLVSAFLIFSIPKYLRCANFAIMVRFRIWLNILVFVLVVLAHCFVSNGFSVSLIIECRNPNLERIAVFLSSVGRTFEIFALQIRSDEREMTQQNNICFNRPRWGKQEIFLEVLVHEFDFNLNETYPFAAHREP